MGKPKPDGAARSNRIIGVILSAMLAVTMTPVSSIQFAFADEPTDRPETTGGDMALQSVAGAIAADEGSATVKAAANGASEAAKSAPVAAQHEDGMLVADGLAYTVADGGLSLVGFDATNADTGSALEGALSVPAFILVDDKSVPVVAINLAEGQVADKVVALAIPQSVSDIATGGLAAAFPNLASIEVAAARGASLPAAAGAAAMRATYSSFGGALLGQAAVEVEGEDGSIESVQCRELLWAPPAAVAVRLPVDCLSLAPGALVDVKGLETVVCFGNVQRIAQAEHDDGGNVTSEGAFTDEQLASITVVFPEASPVVPAEGDGRVSASMALNDAETQTNKRHAWIGLGLPLERLSMGKPTGALTETVAVAEDGSAATDATQLVSYPGMHPRATDVKHPGEDGTIDMADSGLAYTMKSDMTLSVRWEGDITATPPHLEIPATVAIDGVTYPVTEIAASAFEGAVFLASVTVPEGVTTIGKDAFKDCINLTTANLPMTLKAMGDAAFRGSGCSEEFSSRVIMADESLSAIASADSSESAAGLFAVPEEEQIGDMDAAASLLSSDAGAGDDSGGVAESAEIADVGYTSTAADDAITPYYSSTGPDGFMIATNGLLDDLSVSISSSMWSITTSNAAGLACYKATWGSGMPRNYLSFGQPTAYSTTTIVVPLEFGQSGSVGTSARLTIQALNNQAIIGFGISSEGNALFESRDGDVYPEEPVIYISVAPSAIFEADSFVTWDEAGNTFVSETALPTYVKLNKENIGYLTEGDLGGYATTASLSNYVTNKTASETYATKSSLSSYVTTTALNSKGYITQSAADGRYLLKSDAPSLDGYLTKETADETYQPKGSYAAASHTHSQYATTTALNAKANSNLLSKSGETAFTSTSTVRGTTDALSSRISTLEGKTHLELGTTATTAAAGNHTHSQYATTSSLSSYVTTTALNNKLGDLGTSTVKSLLDGKASTSHTHSNYVTNTTAANTYATKTDVSALQTTVGNSTSGLVKDVADLKAIDHLKIGTTSTTAAAGNHTHSQYATTTALNAKANSNLLSKSGETAFTSTSTVRGTTDALSSRISTLEGKTHLELGTTATTAAAGNHTHSQYATTSSLSNYVTNATASSTYATKSSLSSYVTTTALNSKGYLTQTDADKRYLLKDDVPSTDGYITKAEADAAYQPKGDYAAASHTHSNYATTTQLSAKLSSSAISNYNTNAKLDAKFAEKASATDVSALQTTVGNSTSGLVKDVADLKAIDHLKIGTTSTTAAAGNHTHSQYVTNTTAANTYATKSSLSSYVTTTALNSKGYLTQTDADKRYLLKDDVPSVDGYITKTEADAAYQPKGDYAAASHNHDNLYYTESETDAKLMAKLNSSAISNYNTNAKLDAKFAEKADASAVAAAKTTAEAAKEAAEKNAQAIEDLDAAAVKASEFGTISYSGLDGADNNVYPTSYRAGGTPAIHAPVRAGYAFKGWSWSRGEASGGAESLASAFAEAGAVTLTATWEEGGSSTPEAPEGKYFFTSSAPLTAGDASSYQEHVIKVKLSGSQRSVSRVQFEANDKTALLKDTSGVAFWVGTDESVFDRGTQVAWGASTQAGWSAPLVDLGNGAYGLYVGIRIPTAAIDADKVTASYVDGSYVASLVKMNYTFA